MLILTSFLLFTVHIRLTVSEIWEPSGSKREEVCRTEDCLARGKELFNNLSPAVHPCNDFYTFVCGAWYTTNKPPAFNHKWSVRNLMEQELLKELRDILDQPLSRNLDKDIADVKHYYDLCKVLPSFGKSSPKEIKKRIQAIGRAGNKNIWDIHNGYFKLTGESAFFDYGIIATDLKENTPGLVVLGLDTPYGIVQSTQLTSQEESKYLELLYKMTETLNFHESPKSKRAEIEDVVKFRNSLNEIINRYKKNTGSIRVMFEDFLRWNQKQAKEFNNTPRMMIPWEAILKVIFPHDSTKDLKKRIIILGGKGYLEDLYFLMANTKERTIANHMELYFIERHLEYTDEMEDLLEEIVTNPDNRVKPSQPRWKRCIQNSNKPAEIKRIFDKKHSSLKKSVLKIVNGLKNAIVNEVKNSSWLDKPTKRSVIKNIESVQPQIGNTFASGDNTLPATVKANAQDPISANAYLDLVDYKLYINPPLFRPSIMFNPNLPQLYNYATIGYVLGHELFHVFYHCGVKLDKKMQPLIWFPQEMRELCTEKLKCFAKSFTKIIAKEFSEKHRIQPKINAKRTLQEDYADVMGLHAAYLLYKAEEDNKDVCKTLPRFEKYTCDQMFFISFASTYCGTMSPAAAKKAAEEANHSIDSARVNGAVANNDYFHEAFGCPAGSPMNPATKCNLLK